MRQAIFAGQKDWMGDEVWEIFRAFAPGPAGRGEPPMDADF